jgi:hypothetical protein
MDAATLFLLQYRGARDWIERFALQDLSDAQFRIRPQAQLNSVAWIWWHLTRTEDFFVNRVVAHRPQVFEEADWTARLGVPLRRIGTFMSEDEVSGFSEQVVLGALRAYWAAVGERTAAVAAGLPAAVWGEALDPATLRQSLLDAGVFGEDAVQEVELLLPRYLTRPVGGTLSHGALAHPLLHVGEAAMVRTLLGIRGI